MNRNLGIIAAVLAFCCALVVGPASQARAEECTTQGALALALADVLGIKVTSAQAAADALVTCGVSCSTEPKLWWIVSECLTDKVRQEVKVVFAGVVGAKGFERAEAMLGTDSKRIYPDVSPSKP